MKYNNPTIEAAAITDMHSGLAHPADILKRYLQKQRILLAAGKKAEPRGNGIPNKIIKVISPQEELKRARQKQRILKMIND